MSARTAITLVFALLAGPAIAQTAPWQACSNENARCTPGSLPAEVRYGESWGNKWTAPRIVTEPVDCNNAIFGDPSPGTGKRCEWRPVAKPPAGSLKVSWQHATENEDGTALTDRLGYRVELAEKDAGPWAEAGRTETNTLTFPALAARNCVRVVTLATGVESAPTPPVCVDRPPVVVTLPKAPKSITIEFVD